MTRTNHVKFGTHGEALLVSRYCELYWEHNELQLVATPAALELAAQYAKVMQEISYTLGYTPAA